MTRLLPILALLGSAALAQSSATPPTIALDSLPGNGPALLLFDANAGTSSFQSQWSVLVRSAASLSHLTIIPILTETSVPLPSAHGLKVATLSDIDATNARATFHCAGTASCSVLLAKDGTPLQTSGAVSPANLLLAVDPPPTSLGRAIAAGQDSVYRTLISGPTANPFVLADLLDAGRPLLIFAQSADDPAFRAQWRLLTSNAVALIGHNVVVVPILAITASVLPPARGVPVKTLDSLSNTKARSDFSCPSAAFCVVLLDMADKTLLSASSPVSVGAITSAIGPTSQTQTNPRSQRTR